EATGRIKLDLDDPALLFVVREPFISRHSSAQIVAGLLDRQKELIIESRMAVEGTIFSDGIENDFLSFNAGSIARIRPSSQKAHLVLPGASVEAAIARTKKGNCRDL